MGNSSSTDAVFPPYEYERGEEDQIPFEPDGNNPVLSSFGTAMRVVPRSDRFPDIRKAVRKTIRITPTGGREDIERHKNRLRNAAEILSKTRHHHLLNIITTYFYNGLNSVQFSIVVDYAQENLRDYLLMPSVLSSGDNTAALVSAPLPKWFGCLISVVAYLHQRGIRHQDIKPESILVKDKTTILLSNFDISEMDDLRTQPKLARWKTTASWYRAPELEDRGSASYGRAADIFSLGVVFLEMLLAYMERDLGYDLRVGKDSASLPPSSTWGSPGQSRFANLQSLLLASNFGKDSKLHGSSVDTIGCWLAGILPPPEQKGWEPSIFSVCRSMLDTDPNARPLGYELLTQWERLTDSESRAYLRCSLCDETSSIHDTTKRAIHHRIAPRAISGLHSATVSGNADPVKRLLGAGTGAANIDETDGAGQTALHLAAGRGDEEVVASLLDGKVAVDEVNIDGWSPLHFAARGNHKGVIELLLNKGGANINLPDHMGWTALHFAARDGHTSALDQLLANNANVSVVDNMGHTALHLAAKGGHVDVVRILLARLDEADVNRTNAKGHSVLWFAALYNNREVLRVLVESPKADIRILAG